MRDGTREKNQYSTSRKKYAGRSATVHGGKGSFVFEGAGPVAFSEVVDTVSAMSDCVLLIVRLTTNASDVSVLYRLTVPVIVALFLICCRDSK